VHQVGDQTKVTTESVNIQTWNDYFEVTSKTLPCAKINRTGYVPIT